VGGDRNNRSVYEKKNYDTNDYNAMPQYISFLREVKKKKESRNRLGVPQGVPGGLGSQIFMTFGT
jgi:hypothetical protein